MIAEYVIYLEQNFCQGNFDNCFYLFFYPDFFLDGWEGCKEHAINDFPAMHNMAMEKFFIPTEICNQVNLSTKKKWSLILFSSQQEVCGAPPPTKPPQ